MGVAGLVIAVLSAGTGAPANTNAGVRAYGSPRNSVSAHGHVAVVSKTAFVTLRGLGARARRVGGGVPCTFRVHTMVTSWGTGGVG